MANPTDDAAQLTAVVQAVRAVMGDAILGVYLHGSAVVGRLRPTSDLDLLVVASRRTTDHERRDLIGRLLALSGAGDPTGRARSVDLEIVAQGDVRPWRYPGRTDFQYGDWHRAAFERGEDAPWDPANPDLVILLAMVLQADRPLVGPPPSTLLGPLPWADVRRALLDTIPDLQRYLDGDERNVVLTFARIWTTLATGRFVAKDAAADWAIPRLPDQHGAVLARARSLYLEGIAAEDWGPLRPRVRPLVDRLVDEIGRAAAAAGDAPGA